MPKYRNIFIFSDATYEVKLSKNATAATALYARRPKGKETRYIARYFPSEKRWRVYDARQFTPGPQMYGKPTYRAGPYFTAPEEAAAVMAAMMHL